MSYERTFNSKGVKTFTNFKRYVTILHKLGLVSPTKCENRYRYYTDRDILDLQYIEAFKYADFTQGEINQFFDYKRSLESEEDCHNIELLLKQKRLSMSKKSKPTNR